MKTTNRRADADGRWRRFVATVKQVVGMPNYERYVRHLETCHPGCAVPTEREYYDEYLKGKYGGTISRCC